MMEHDVLVCETREIAKMNNFSQMKCIVEDGIPWRDLEVEDSEFRTYMETGYLCKSNLVLKAIFSVRRVVSVCYAGDKNDQFR